MLLCIVSISVVFILPLKHYIYDLSIYPCISYLLYHLSSVYLVYLYHLYFSVIYPSVASSVHHIIDTLCYPKVHCRIVERMLKLFRIKGAV